MIKIPQYSPFPYNSEVLEVLCCVILGFNKIKNIRKILKQPQSTISEKMSFLRKNKAVIKKKWVFEPNWNVIYKIMYDLIKKNISPSGRILYYYKSRHNYYKYGSKYPAIRKEIEEENKIREILKINKSALKQIIPQNLLQNILINYSILYLDEFGYEKLSLNELICKFLDRLVIEEDKNIYNIDRKFGSRLIELKKIVRFREIDNEIFFSFLTKSKTDIEHYIDNVKRELLKKIDG